MDPYADSTDRGAADYVLVALSCVAVLLGLTGVIVASPGLAFVGGLLVLLAITCFAVRRSPGE